MKKIQSLFLPALVAGVATIFSSGIACADNIFVSNSGGDSIEEIAADGTSSVFATTNLKNPTGIAFDSAGNLFVSNNGTSNNAGSILEFSSNGTFIQTFATGQQYPRGLAFDTAGNLYVANQAAGTIQKFTPGGVGSIFASDLSSPNALAFDSAGNLFVTEGTGNSIAVITPGGFSSTLTITGNALNSPNGIAFDSAGNIFVVNHSDPSIEIIAPGGVGTLFPVDTSTLNLPKTLAFDSVGNLYVTDYGDNTVTEYDAAGNLINSFTAGLAGPCFVTTQLVVPEPSTYALLLAGLGILLYMNRRKVAKVPALI